MFIFSVLSLFACLLIAGCQDDNKKESTKKDTQENKKTLVEQGFSIKSIRSFDDDINVVKLEKDGQEYIATINNDFEILMEPTDKYESLYFFEGLAKVSEERGNGKFYGFIDAKGKEVIDPQYESADSFSDGLAVVTIEDNGFAIDKNGKEVFEIKPTANMDVSEGEKIIDWFKGGYAYSVGGFFTKEGKYVQVDKDEENYIVINDKIFENKITADEAEYYGANTEILVKDFNGNVVNSFKTDGTKLYLKDTSLSFNVLKHLNENNAFIARGIHGNMLIDASTMKVILEDFDSDIADGLLFKREDEDHEDLTGTFYDYTGQKVYSVKDMTGGIIYNGKYFIEGKEYYKLIDTEGNVLIDEDKKITSISFSNYGDDVEQKRLTKPRKLAKIEFEDSTGAEKEGLLNLDTLEIISLEEL